MSELSAAPGLGSVLGKNVLVTGGGSGIGRAVVSAMAAGGANVIIADLNYERAQNVAQECAGSSGRITAAQVDVASLESMGALAQASQTFGGLDIIVHSAGQWMDYCPLVSCSEEIWRRMLDVNLTSHFYLTQQFAPAMIERKQGSIVFVSSVSGRTGGTGGTIPYAVTKGGVNALMRGLAHELAPYGVRVNAIAPGLVETPLLNRPANKERTDSWIKRIPLGRPAHAHEMVGAIMLLASDAGSYITGELIEINGGISMN